jgi:hypothetical protein
MSKMGHKKAMARKPGQARKPGSDHGFLTIGVRPLLSAWIQIRASARSPNATLRLVQEFADFDARFTQKKSGSDPVLWKKVV